MTVLYLILLIVAAVLFVLAALSVDVRRLNLVALGLFFWVLVPILQTLKSL